MHTTLESPKCPVCNEAMKPDKVSSGPFGRTGRYRCTCGHCEQRDEPPPLYGERPSDAAAAMVLEASWRR